MKNIFFLLLLMGTLVACSSDDDAGQDNITSAMITLQNTSGGTESGIVIYAYDESTWSVIGDDPTFADFQASSNNDGIATFTNLTSDLTFNELTNNTQTFRFSAHYTLNGNATTKVKAITFNLGDDKTDTIILD
ncbi:hypothetical protein [Winogradskyella sediminis]|nr:hypothetical protein [Winogradskyella sediminis]